MFIQVPDQQSSFPEFIKYFTTPCTSTLQVMDWTVSLLWWKEVPCMTTLLVVARGRPCMYILLAVERDTLSTPILLVLMKGIPNAHLNCR
jgi:hypothetical protein